MKFILALLSLTSVALAQSPVTDRLISRVLINDTLVLTFKRSDASGNTVIYREVYYSSNAVVALKKREQGDYTKPVIVPEVIDFTAPKPYTTNMVTPKGK